DAPEAAPVTTLAELSAIVTRSADGTVKINGEATVDAPDIVGTNGVIHGVDTVIMPANIVKLVSAHPALTSLATAVTTLMLVDALSATDGAGFTVFAPTDAAFAAFVAGQDALDNFDAFLSLPGTASEIVTYHATAAGAIKADDLAPAQFVKTLSEDYHAVVTKTDADGVMVNKKATVTTADIIGTNGIIHVVDKVFTPATITGLATAHPDFSTLVTALAQEDLATTFDAKDMSYTVFAPNNAAFEGEIMGNMDLDSVEDLLGLENLANILKFHAIGSAVMSTDLQPQQTVESLFTDNSLEIISGEDGVTVQGTAVTAPDIKAKNGVIHGIEGVLIP
ncbi:MAG: fasciclin domain-containing protein, partial [Myxococcota bacterium]|nr:fasciclin domain-containing protein [Myxococcota bacterium]